MSEKGVKVGMEEGKLVPKLRFSEFRDKEEWTHTSLQKLFDFQDGFAFKSTDFVKSKENATQVIRITDINNRNSNEDKVYIPDLFLKTNNLSKYIVERGDLLLSLTGAAGFNFFLWSGEQAVINQRTAKITSKDVSNSALTLILEPLIHDQINARGEGQNNNLSKEFLNNITLPIPETKEQQKIADCLTSLDELITAENEKLDALKTHKKGLMQQLFPREGESVPRLRFPEFEDAGEWERKVLFDVCTRITEKIGNKKLIPVSISAGIGFVSQSKKFGRDISGKQYKNYIHIKRGDFAYNKGHTCPR